MKSKLLKLTVAALMVFTIKVQAQAPTYTPATLGAPVFYDGFESWAGTPSLPTNWMKPPTTTIPSGSVTPAVTSTATPAEEGTMACNLRNTATTYSYMATAASYSVTQNMGYEISYYARGKGTISVGVATGTVNTAPGGEPVSGKTWHHYKQSVIAPATSSTAAFFIKVKGTGTYTSGGVSIQGVDVDSFCVRPYTVTPFVDLYSLQYTTLTNGNSPFYGQAIGLTGGIVTAVTVGSTGVNGYYVQTSKATNWAAMSVYDFNNAPLVHVGDSVLFNGNVDEFFNMTQVSGVTTFTNVSSISGMQYPIHSLALTTSSINDEQYEAMLVNIQGATVNTYTTGYGQATITDGSGVSCLADLKDGFYAPNGTATAGSTGLPGYVPVTGQTYCFIGNVYYSFGFNIEPRDSADVHVGTCAATWGIQKNNNTLHASVYPNPANNQLTIELANEATKINVSLMDVLGKEVYTLNNQSGNKVSLNDINVPAGVYMVKIVADGNTQITKIIKQ